ncbi:MAG: peptidase M23 [Deltaproteobacteria bacterium]|nr:MAG: peptidase M23 [Deltaproteobacteria bacterium]
MRYFKGLLLFVALIFAAAAAFGAVTIRTTGVRVGDIFSVEESFPAGTKSASISFKGVTLPLMPDGSGRWSALAGVDLESVEGPAPLTITHTLSGGETYSEEVPLNILPRVFREQHITVDDSKVFLSEEDRARANKENREIRAALAKTTEERLWKSPFALPIEGRHSSPFGLQRYYNGEKGSYHSGLDIAAAKDSEIYASSEGRVALVGDYFYTGNTVFLDHGLGLYTAYFHMETVAVKAGDLLKAGDLIGGVGSTGRSTGPHLHWGVYVGGVKVDPLSLVAVTKSLD